MRKPFIHALAAASYIALIVSVINLGTPFVQNESLVIPMGMLSLFVLSVAVMAFLFFSEPVQLLMEGKKHEALAFFGKTIGFFACFVVLFAIIVLILN